MTTTSNLQAGVRGEYRLVVNTPQGERDTGWFDNLILDQGLDFLGMDVYPVYYASIGTGTAPPDVSQTSLSAHTAYATVNNSGMSTVVNLGAPSYASQHTFSYTFAQGAVVGNMTEVGVGVGVGVEMGPHLPVKSIQFTVVVVNLSGQGKLCR